jgi:Fic family protein
MYIPPFTITDEVTSLIADIAEKVGHLSVTADNLPATHLRKENRIKTIQSSLAIENNSLSVDQVTAILEGKRVPGPPNEIQEVKNAIDA